MSGTELRAKFRLQGDFGDYTKGARDAREQQQALNDSMERSAKAAGAASAGLTRAAKETTEAGTAAGRAADQVGELAGSQQQAGRAATAAAQDQARLTAAAEATGAALGHLDQILPGLVAELRNVGATTAASATQSAQLTGAVSQLQQIAPALVGALSAVEQVTAANVEQSAHLHRSIGGLAQVVPALAGELRASSEVTAAHIQHTQALTQSVVALQGEMREVGAAVSQATEQLRSAGSAGERGLGQVEGGAHGASAAMGQLKAAVVGYLSVEAAVAGARWWIERADGYVQLSARLKVATRSQQEYAAAEAQTYRVAQQTGSQWAATGSSYIKLADAVRELGGNSQQATAIVESLTHGLRISGATAEEKSSVLLQFAQGFGAGAIRGEEFNAVMEGGRTIMEAVAAALGKNVGELRSMAEAGRLTSGVVGNSLISQLDRLKAKSAEIPNTMSEAWTKVDNALIQAIGRFNDTYKVTQTLAGGLTWVSENLDTIGAVVEGVGIVVAAVVAGRIAGPLLGQGVAAVQAFAATWAGMSASVKAGAVVVGGSLLALDGANRVVIASTAALRTAGTGLLTMLGGWPGVVASVVVGWTAWSAATDAAGDHVAQLSEEIDKNIKKLKEQKGILDLTAKEKLQEKLEETLAEIKKEERNLRGLWERGSGDQYGDGRNHKQFDELPAAFQESIRSHQTELDRLRAVAEKAQAGLAGVTTSIQQNGDAALRAVQPMSAYTRQMSEWIADLSADTSALGKVGVDRAVEQARAKIAGMRREAQAELANTPGALKEALADIDKYEEKVLGLVRANYRAQEADSLRWNSAAEELRQLQNETKWITLSADERERLSQLDQMDVEIKRAQAQGEFGLAQQIQATRDARAGALQQLQDARYAQYLGNLEEEIKLAGQTEKAKYVESKVREKVTREMEAEGGAWKDLADNIREAEGRRYDATQGAEEMISGMEREMEVMHLSNVEQEVANNLWRAGVDAQSELGQRLADTTRQLAEQREAMSGPYIKAFQQFGTGLRDVFKNSFRDALDGADTFGENLKELLKDTLTELATIAVSQKIIIPVVMEMGGALNINPQAMGDLVRQLGGTSAQQTAAQQGGSGLGSAGSWLGSAAQWGQKAWGTVSGWMSGAQATTTAGGYWGGVSMTEFVPSSAPIVTSGAAATGGNAAAGGASTAAGASSWIATAGFWGAIAYFIYSMWGEEIHDFVNNTDLGKFLQQTNDPLDIIDTLLFGPEATPPHGAIQTDSNQGDLWKNKNGQFIGAESPFGFIGFSGDAHHVGGEQKTPAAQKYFAGLAEMDKLLAGFMDADDIAHVKAAMDGWQSSTANAFDNFKKSATERLAAIVTAVDGDLGKLMAAYKGPAEEAAKYAGALLQGRAVVKAINQELDALAGKSTAVDGVTARIQALDEGVGAAVDSAMKALATGDPTQYVPAAENLRQLTIARYNEEVAMVRGIQAAIEEAKRTAWQWHLSLQQKIDGLTGGSESVRLIEDAGRYLLDQYLNSTDPALRQKLLQDGTSLIDQWLSESQKQVQTWLSQQQAALDARRKALEAERSAIQKAAQDRRAALEEEARIAQSWQSVLQSATQMLEQWRYTATSPLPPSIREGLLDQDISELRRQYDAATGDEKSALASKLLQSYQQAMSFLQEMEQRPSPEYIARYNELIEAVSGVADDAKSETEQLIDVQRRIEELDRETNDKLAQIDASLAALDAEGAALQEEANRQLDAIKAQAVEYYTWVQTEGDKNYQALIQGQQDQLNAITGGLDADSFIAKKQQEMVAILGTIRDTLIAQKDAAVVDAGKPPANDGGTDESVTPPGPEIDPDTGLPKPKSSARFIDELRKAGNSQPATTAVRLSAPQAGSDSPPVTIELAVSMPISIQAAPGLDVRTLGEEVRRVFPRLLAEEVRRAAPELRRALNRG